MKEIVIKIDEEMYKWVCDVNKFFNDYRTGDFIDLIKNGKPLPKGHGDLIDRGEVVKSLFDCYICNGTKTIGQCIDDVKTIIEADKEDGNE